jgi:hypothetical protein|tara:strand:- start:1090 stop:1473 length:384 start_codon:yes stop_codon:yes gene_type:complete
MTYTQMKAADLIATAAETLDPEVASKCHAELARRTANNTERLAGMIATLGKKDGATQAQVDAKTNLVGHNAANEATCLTYVKSLTRPAPKAKAAAKTTAKRTKRDEVAELKAEIATLHTLVQQLVGE